MEEPVKRFELHFGVILMVRTKRFLSVMDRIGRNPLSKPIGWGLLYLMPVAAATALLLFINVFWALASSRGAQVASGIVSLGPLANLGIPGLNPYIPILYGWIALVVGMVVHEGAHGVIARSLGLPVKNSGLILFLFVIPIGAFVDIDETVIKQAKKSHSARVLAAGAGTNLVLAILCLLLLASIVGSMRPAADGIPVSQVNLPSPAAKAGVLPGDFILSIDGIPYNDGSQILNASWYRPGTVVNVTVWRQGETKVLPMTVGARPNTTLTCASPIAPGATGTCTAVVSGFLGTVSGDNVTFGSSGPGSFSPASCTIIGDSCSVEYAPSATQGSLQNLTAIYQGDTYNLYSSATYQVRVEGTSGVAGPTSQTAAVSKASVPDPAHPLGYIGTESLSNSVLTGMASAYASVLRNPVQYMCIPTLPQCQSIVPFAGATGIFYTSALGPATIPLANVLYWMFFLNFNLAIFNALPIYPLDGGQAFRVGVEALGKGRFTEEGVSRITVAVTAGVLLFLLGIILGPYLYVLVG